MISKFISRHFLLFYFIFVFNTSAEGNQWPYSFLLLAKENVDAAKAINWENCGARVLTNGDIEVFLRLQVAPGFSVYKKRLHFETDPGLFVKNIKYPESSLTKGKSGSEAGDEIIGGGEFIVTLNGFHSANNNKIGLTVKFTGCSESLCLMPRQITLESNLSSADSFFQSCVKDVVGKHL